MVASVTESTAPAVGGGAAVGGAPVAPVVGAPASAPQSGGRKKNSWLAHVKATMRGHRNKSFKQVLKIAKKTYRKKAKYQGKSRSRRNYQNQNQNQNQDQNQNENQDGGKKRKQRGGSGVGGGREGMSAFAENAGSVV
jgi:hypothetical protein